MGKHVLFLLFACFGSGQAKAEYFTITNYHVKVTFTEEGFADFEELIEVQFTEPRHGIFREIPLRSIIDGKTVDRIIQNIRVDGFDFSKSTSNHNLMLKIGDKDIFVEGRQLYRIHYRVLNPLNFYKEGIEFYWDLLGSSWPVVVDEASFELVFPARIQLEPDDARCFTGPRGSTTQNGDVQVIGNKITGRSTVKFMPQEAMTLAVRLPKTAFEPMSDWENFRERHGLLLAPFFFLFSGLLALFMARNRKQPVMTEFFPPEDLSPAIAGGFVDHSVDAKDVLCLIPHLANKGYLRLEMIKGGWLSKNNIIFYKLKEAGTELMAFEKQFFDALFASGDRVELKDLKDKFYVHLAAVRAVVKKWIQDQGWYEADQKTLGCVTSLAALAALIWGGYALSQENLDGLALIGTGILLFVFAGKFNKRTPKGNETYQKLAGFREFIKKAERPVIEKLMHDDPLYYDKTMPYALAFGYLDKWNKHFDGLLTQPPSWYSGPGMHGNDMSRSWSSFSESFSSEVDNIGSVFSSSPSSSSSSGGGGSSGGGSGGGGGGSW